MCDLSGHGEQVNYRGENKLWIRRRLPELFGLSDWATLKAGDDSDGWSKHPELPDSEEGVVVRGRDLAIDNN